MTVTNARPEPGAFEPTQMAGLADLAARFRSRELSVEQVTRAYLDRIDAVDVRLGAFTFVARDSALQAAQSMDRLLDAGTDLGPLMGVPVAVKDLYTVSAMPTTAGTSMAIDDLLEGEGSFIRQLKRCGCIILGKTTTTEFAAGTINLTKRAPWNPRDLQTQRMPGGSSSGSAVAMAADLCALALGSDTGGSVRQPAALCGVTGYKCTAGMWATDGVFPLSPTLDSLGLFAKSASDVAHAFAALGSVLAPQPIALQGVRLGIPKQRFFENLEPGIEASIELALRELSRNGVELVEFDFPEVAESDEMFAKVVPTELAAFLGDERIAAGKHLVDPVVRARLEAASDLRATEYVRLVHRHRTAVKTAAERLSGLHGWLAPTTPLFPIPVAECSTVESAVAWNKRSLRNTQPVNYVGQCGVSLPVPLSAPSLPVGLQVAAAPSRDAHLLGLAIAIERAIA
jgi:aspartyl-tRNA(Asn)/glutamyl-tRNA(Gln) amidotransferase subunit A